jgi:carboxylesterase type B
MASPCIWPRQEPSRQQAVFDEVLKAANCTSVTCLRDTSQEALFKANSFLITNVSDGRSGALGPGTGFTPVVDGIYIRDLLPVLLKQGLYNRGVKEVVLGNMANEGMGMIPDIDLPHAFPALVRETIPYAGNATIKRIQSLYKYRTDLPQKLAWDWATDMTFACNAYFTAKAYKNKARRYVMTIPPATHALDQSCMLAPVSPLPRPVVLFVVRLVLTISQKDFFFQNNITTPVVDIALAKQFQEYVRRFVTGAKNLDFSGLAPWPKYGAREASFNVTLDGFEVEKDFWDVNRRCEVLNEIFSDRKNGA